MSDQQDALVAIQELHKPSDVEEFFNTLDGGTDSRIVLVCERCEDPDSNGYEQYPCATRRLVDEALTARTTKNGDNK